MTATVPSTSLTTPALTNRRKTPRFDTLGRIVGNLTDVDLPVRIREIGLGGFSVETVDPLPAGAGHRVRFTAADNWSVELDARTVHSHPSCAADGSPRFATGFAFTPDQESDAAVKCMIEKITSVQLFGA